MFIWSSWMALDLGSIQALDSAGIGVIIQIHTEINKRSGEFFVYGCPSTFERIFASTKLATVIRLHSTFEQGAGLES